MLQVHQFCNLCLQVDKSRVSHYVSETTLIKAHSKNATLDVYIGAIHKCGFMDTVLVSLHSEPLFLSLLLLTYLECSSNSLSVSLLRLFLSPVFVSVLVLFSCLYPLALKSWACPVAEVSPGGFESRVQTTAVSLLDLGRTLFCESRTCTVSVLALCSHQSEIWGHSSSRASIGLDRRPLKLHFCCII